MKAGRIILWWGISLGGFYLAGMTIIFIAALLAVRPASFRGDGSPQETALTHERTTTLEESGAIAAPTATFSAVPTATPSAAPTATPLAVPACASCLKTPLRSK